MCECGHKMSMHRIADYGKVMVGLQCLGDGIRPSPLSSRYLANCICNKVLRMDQLGELEEAQQQQSKGKEWDWAGE